MAIIIVAFVVTISNLSEVALLMTKTSESSEELED